MKISDTYKIKDTITEAEEPFEAYGDRPSHDVMSMISSARKGVTVEHITRLAQDMSLSTRELAHVLHLSLRSLQRYDGDKVLDTDHSSVALQLEQLYYMGLDVLGGKEAFAEWLKSPLPALNGGRPLDFLDSPFGFQLVEQMLGRIRHGVFA